MSKTHSFDTNFQYITINNHKHKIIDSTTVLDLEAQRATPGLKDQDYYVKNYQFNWSNITTITYSNN